MRRLVSPIFLASALACLAIAPLTAGAATPPSGTLSAPAQARPGATSEIAYDGGPAFGASALQGTAETVCPAGATTPGVCDVFMLTLDIPADYWQRNAGVIGGRLEVTIDWSDQPGAESQDVDLIVTDEDGVVFGRGETDNISSGIPHETAVLVQPPRGTFRVVAAGIVGGVAAYSGSARLVLADPVRQNTILSTGVQFGPATFVSPVLFGAEPGLNADPSGGGRWWTDWPVSSRSHMGVAMRSTDGGDSFRQMVDPSCPERRQPGCATSGGGDTEIALAPDGKVFFANQESLANEAACTSDDHGMTWTNCQAITSLDATNDRQWLTAHDENLAYLSATTVAGVRGPEGGPGVGGVSLVRTEDGGATWNTVQSALFAEAPGPSAPMHVDSTGGPNDGTLYMLSRGAGLTLSVSRDRGTTVTSWPSDPETGTGPCAGCNPSPILIPWMSMDRAGNLYVAWADDSDHAVYMTTMLASDPRNAGAKLGSTWSKPVKVSVAPARSTVFAQVIAGDAGRVAIAYQGADTDYVSSDAPDDTPWKVYAAFSGDALCQWTDTCKGSGPALEQLEVSPRVNHTGQICVSGIGCTVNGKDRDLLDFFDIGVDGDGRVGVVWSDDNHSLTQPYVMFAKVLNGPSLRAGKPAFRAQAPLGAVKARKGDAIWPINAQGGRNFETLDVSATALTWSPAKLDIRVDIGSAGDLAPGLEAGNTIAGQLSSKHIKYVTMWHHQNDVYFVAADTLGEFDDENNTIVDFYGGKVDANDAMISPFTPAVDFGSKFVEDFPVEGAIDRFDNTITFTIPDLSLIGGPQAGDRLLSVQTFALVGPSDAYVTIYTTPDVIDATPPFDMVLGAAAPPKPPAKVGGVKKRPPARPQPKRPLPATGTNDALLVSGVALLAAGAVTWRRLRRPLPR